MADAIRQSILVGTLAPGDKIPSEKELGVAHGVSRVVVREAIARLRHEGLAAARQGKGVFVASPGSSRFLDIADELLTKPEDYRKLYELRLVLEAGSAALAAEHRDAKDLKAIGGFLETMRAEENFEQGYVEADIGFHRAIAAASKNPFMGLFTSFVARRLQDSIALALRSLDFKSTVRVSVAEHMDILARIRAGDSKGAAAAMQRHLNNSSRRLGLRPRKRAR